MNKETLYKHECIIDDVPLIIEYTVRSPYNKAYYDIKSAKIIDSTINLTEFLTECQYIAIDNALDTIYRLI